MNLSRRGFMGGGLALGLTSPAGALTSSGATSRIPREYAYDRDTLVVACPELASSVRFTVIADSHFTLEDERDAAYEPNMRRMRQWPAQEKDLDAALGAAKKWGSEVVVLVGDMFSFPTCRNVEFIDGKMSSCGLKCLYVAGNHDWHFEGLPGSDEAQRAEWIEKRLQPLYRGANPLMSSHRVGGVRFVLLDDSTYHVSKEQLEFVRAEIRSGDPVCLFMHIPFYMPLRPSLGTLGNRDWGAKTDEYWEIEQRERWPVSGQGEEAFALRDLVLGSENVVGVFAGHEHFLQVAAERGVIQCIVPKNHGGRFMNVELRNVRSFPAR